VILAGKHSDDLETCDLGDVARRYDGEEFAIIAPRATAAALPPRIDRLRAALTSLWPRQGARALGPISLSFGVAECGEVLGRDNPPLIASADAALYRARGEARDRAIVAERRVADLHRIVDRRDPSDIATSKADRELGATDWIAASVSHRTRL
jgi:predicted signal transduction protein with EAL and GGDEF domain